MSYNSTYVDRVIGSYTARLNECAWEYNIVIMESSPESILLEPDDDIVEAILNRRRQIITIFNGIYSDFVDFCKIFHLDHQVVASMYLINNTKKYVYYI